MLCYKDMLFKLTELVSVSGNEAFHADAIKSLASPYFDEVKTDAVGNVIFIRRCKKENAPRLMVDAHYDTVGFIVSDINENGTLRLVNAGGIDKKILPASEVLVHGSKGFVYGVLSSTPPHLTPPSERNIAVKLDKMFVDTGYDKNTLEEEFGIRIGTPVTYKTTPVELLNGRLAGAAFDDKACLAAAFLAADMLNEEGIDGVYDLYIVASASEETGMSGAAKAAFSIKPALALVLDVGFATSPDTPEKNGASPLKSGIIVSYSEFVSIKLTRKLMKIMKDEDIKFTISVEPSGTGTNGDNITLVEGGIPVAVLGIPLRSMHTSTEVIACEDAEQLARLVVAVMKNESLEEWISEAE